MLQICRKRCGGVWVEDEKIELDRREYVMSSKA